MVTCYTALLMAHMGGSSPAWTPDTTAWFGSGRPYSTGYKDDPITGARCHWLYTSDESKCDIAFVAVQDAWEAQVNGQGWTAPFPDDGEGGTDGLDIYFHYDAWGGAYTLSDYFDYYDDDGRMASWAYIVIDPVIVDAWIPEFIAHEFNHVLQFGTDMAEPSLAAWEGAAVMAEEHTYEGQGSWDSYGEDFQATPWASVLGDGYWLDFAHGINNSFYEYGTAVWFMYLEHELGITAAEL
jgi:hypothetical protein